MTRHRIQQKIPDPGMNCFWLNINYKLNQVPSVNYTKVYTVSQNKVSHFYFRYYFAIGWDICTINKALRVYATLYHVEIISEQNASKIAKKYQQIAKLQQQ